CKNKEMLIHSQLITESQSSSSSTQDNTVASTLPVNRKSETESQQEQLENQSISSLQNQFYAGRKRVSKLSTIEDMKVAQDIRATFEGIMKVYAEKADKLNNHLNPIQREKLFEEISWNGANVIFQCHKVEPAFPREKRGLARCALESAEVVNQDVASDTQIEREFRLKDVYEVAQTEDVLSQSTKEKFKSRKNEKQSFHVELEQRRRRIQQIQFWNIQMEV
ncbi:MAG: hypothetical protein EZS28_050193, partial [Streblomastix strix]